MSDADKIRTLLLDGGPWHGKMIDVRNDCRVLPVYEMWSSSDSMYSGSVSPTTEYITHHYCGLTGEYIGILRTSPQPELNQ